MKYSIGILFLQRSTAVPVITTLDTHQLTHVNTGAQHSMAPTGAPESYFGNMLCTRRFLLFFMKKRGGSAALAQALRSHPKTPCCISSDRAETHAPVERRDPMTTCSLACHRQIPPSLHAALKV